MNFSKVRKAVNAKKGFQIAPFALATLFANWLIDKKQWYLQLCVVTSSLSEREVPIWEILKYYVLENSV